VQFPLQLEIEKLETRGGEPRVRAIEKNVLCLFVAEPPIIALELFVLKSEFCSVDV
jgi:hypothetical protein